MGVGGVGWFCFGLVEMFGASLTFSRVQLQGWNLAGRLLGFRVC